MPFRTPLRAELVDHLANDGQGEWMILAPLEYITDAGVLYVVMPGFRTDFATVPRAPFAYLLTGNTAHAPAALHDWLIRQELVARDEADRIFLEAMESIGMPAWRAGAMYRAVCGYTRQLAARDKPWSDDVNSG